MTKARLEGLPMHALLALSRKENLDVDADVTREELIESLFEAYEEDRKEKEALNSLIIKIEESKFALFQDEDLVIERDPLEGLIPEKYDETYATLMLRDPNWAFAYWEIKSHDADALSTEWGFKGYALRVYELAHIEDTSKTFFMIPVAQTMGSRYINLPTTNMYYFLELHALFEKESRLLCRSKVLHAPSDDPPYSFLSGESGLKQKKFLELSGLLICEPRRDHEAEDASDNKNAIPQRIGDLNESMFLED